MCCSCNPPAGTFIADALDPCLEKLSRALSEDYGGALENLWIDFDLCPAHADDGPAQHVLCYLLPLIYDLCGIIPAKRFALFLQFRSFRPPVNYSAPSDDGKGLGSGAEAWAMARGVTPSRRRIARAM